MVVRWHELCEVVNECSSCNFRLFAIRVGGNLTKLWQKLFCLVFETRCRWLRLTERLDDSISPSVNCNKPNFRRFWEFYQNARCQKSNLSTTCRKWPRYCLLPDFKLVSGWYMRYVLFTVYIGACWFVLIFKCYNGHVSLSLSNQRAASSLHFDTRVLNCSQRCHIDNYNELAFAALSNISSALLTTILMRLLELGQKRHWYCQ